MNIYIHTNVYGVYFYCVLYVICIITYVEKRSRAEGGNPFCLFIVDE